MRRSSQRIGWRRWWVGSLEGLGVRVVTIVERGRTFWGGWGRDQYVGGDSHKKKKKPTLAIPFYAFPLS